MNRMEKLKRIRERRAQYRRFLAMYGWHFPERKEQTKIQEARLRAILKQTGYTR